MLLYVIDFISLLLEPELTKLDFWLGKLNVPTKLEVDIVI